MEEYWTDWGRASEVYGDYVRGGVVPAGWFVTSPMYNAMVTVLSARSTPEPLCSECETQAGDKQLRLQDRAEGLWVRSQTPHVSY